MDFMDVCQEIHFDEVEMDANEMEASFCSQDNFCQLCQPVTTALNEEPAPPRARRVVSTDSGASGDLSSGGVPRSDFEGTHGLGGGSLFDDYVVLPAILGTGSYGCVRECVHRTTGIRYAVKTIDKSRVSRHDHLRREVQLLLSVDHPGIAGLVDFYEDYTYVHIVTEMCSGGELYDRIVARTTDDGCLDETEARRIVRSVLEAVAYLHSRDIVHRDIKPENLLFETREEGSAVKLVDFGLSRTHRTNETAMTNQVGTPYYMSPDVLEGRYDRSCDLWAVGVTAYVMLTGYPPFHGANGDEVRRSILAGDVRFGRKVWSNASPSARDFVDRLLRRDATSRMSSAEEALRHPWMARA